MAPRRQLLRAHHPMTRQDPSTRDTNSKPGRAMPARLAAPRRVSRAASAPRHEGRLGAIGTCALRAHATPTGSDKFGPLALLFGPFRNVPHPENLRVRQSSLQAVENPGVHWCILGVHASAPFDDVRCRTDHVRQRPATRGAECCSCFCAQTRRGPAGSGGARRVPIG